MTVPLVWRNYPERYNLLGNFCENCSSAYFPARPVCPKCRRKGRLVVQEMPRTGKIVSFTEVFVAPEGFENEAPYFLALIELENGAKILSQVVDSKKEKVRMGARVERCFRKIADNDAEGAIAYGYKFKIVE